MLNNNYNNAIDDGTNNKQVKKTRMCYADY